MKRGVSSGQGTAALVKSATISTSLSGPVHADRLCQKGRVTSLHNHKGHRHVRVRRGSIHTLKTQRCKKKFTASEIFFRAACRAWASAAAAAAQSDREDRSR